MPKFQIRFCDKHGHGSFQYVDGEINESIEQKAAEKATHYITKQKQHYEDHKSWNPFVALNPPKPKRIVHVWEMDMETKEPKKKGYRFKLELSFTEITFGSGQKVRNEWYKPIIEPAKARNNGR